MATNSLKERIKAVVDGEDGDQAYRRLYADQTKPCDFRRWFAAIQRDKSCREISEELNLQIAESIKEGMVVEEAFRLHCPEFVGPGEFSVAYDQEMRSRKPPAAEEPRFRFVSPAVAGRAAAQSGPASRVERKEAFPVTEIVNPAIPVSQSEHQGSMAVGEPEPVK